MYKNVNGKPVSYNFLGSFIAPVLGGVAGYLGASKQADAAEASNAIQQQNLDWERQKYQPVVSGAQQELGYSQQFAPYTAAQQQLASQAAGAGQAYLKGTQPYYEAGQEGVHALRNLAQQSGAPATLGLAQQYFNPYVQAQTQAAAGSINTAADKARRDAAIRAASRGSSLSGQAARIASGIEGQRQSNLAQSATDIHSNAYNQALQQARTQQGYQQGLGSALAGLGGTGLSQATQASNLGQSAATQGIQAPFAPYNAYSQAIQGTSLPTYTPQAAPSALGAGLGSGLQYYYAQQKANQGE